MKKYLPLLALMIIVHLFTACNTAQKAIQNAQVYEQNGNPCSGLDELITRMSHKRLGTTKRQEVDASVKRIGSQCMTDHIEEAKSIRASARNSQQFKSAYSKVETAKSKMQHTNRRFGRTLLTWAGEYETLSKTLYVEVTEALYQEAIVTFQSGRFEAAYGQFETIQKRDYHYKQVSTYLQQSFDKWSKSIYPHALSLYKSERYRSAYQQFSRLTDKNSRLAHRLYSDLEGLMSNCIEEGAIYIYFDGDNWLSTKVYQLFNSRNNNPFVQFAGASHQADYTVRLAFQHDVHYPTPEKKVFYAHPICENKETVTSESGETKEVVKYGTTEKEIAYEWVRAMKEVVCSVTYAILGTGRGDTFRSSNGDRIEYYDYSGQLASKNLGTEKITATNSRKNIPTVAQLLEKHPKRTFLTDSALKNAVQEDLIRTLIGAIQRDMEVLASVD